MAEETVAETNEVSAEDIAEAKALGWVDKDQWRGKPEDHLDAKSFLDKGRHLLPVMQENSRRLREQMKTLEAQVSSQQQALAAATATIKTLEESHDEDVKAQVAAARAALKDELATASEQGDHKAVADLTDKLAQLGKAEDKAEVREEKNRRASDRAEPGTREITGPYAAEVKQWFADHPIYTKDLRRQALANAVTVELRQAGNTKMGAAFCDEVAAEVEKVLGGEAGVNRVSSSRSSESRASGGKTYADLPADVKAICDRQGAKVIGPNRAHKDQASWRASYVRQYFGE